MPHPAYLMMKLPLIALALWLLWRTVVKRRPIRFAWQPWGFVRSLFLIALIGLSGCSHTEELATAKGTWFQLNPDHWQAKPDDLNPPKSAK